jgi:hypothetical protein
MHWKWNYPDLKEIYMVDGMFVRMYIYLTYYLIHYMYTDNGNH